MRVQKVACPKCHAALKSARGLAVGKAVKCPQCGESFVVPAAQPARPAGAAPTEAAGEAGPVRGQVSLSRLAGVLGGAVVFLGVGLGLLVYCVSHRQGVAAAAPETAAPPEAAPPPPAAPLITLPPEQQVKVTDAINRGVRFLKATQQPTGTWNHDHPVGQAALPGLVLMECGVPASDPNVDRAAEFVRKNAAQLTNTYELSLAILFLDHLLGAPGHADEHKDAELIQTLALRLIAGQTPGGSWDYTCPVLGSDDQQRFLHLLRSLGADPYSEWRKAHAAEAERLTPVLRDRAVLQDADTLKDEALKSWSGDNSNTQFAILALWAARRQQVPMERTMALMVRHFRATQNPDGSWNYNRGTQMASPPWPTMTAAGLLGLAIGHGMEKESPAGPARADPAIDKALLLLSKSIGKPAEHGPGKGRVALANLYFLWSVERVGVIFNRKTIHDRDWYPWGAEMLLDNQDDNRGNWQNGGYPGSNPTIDTCFALLFLEQANLAKDLTSKLQLLAGGKK